MHYAAQLIKKKGKPNADTDIVRLLLKHTADCTAITTVVSVDKFSVEMIIKITTMGEERDRETETETETETERDRERQRETEPDRETERDRD